MASEETAKAKTDPKAQPKVDEAQPVDEPKADDMQDNMIAFKLPPNETESDLPPDVQKTDDPNLPYRMNRDEYHRLAAERGW